MNPFQSFKSPGGPLNERLTFKIPEGIEPGRDRLVLDGISSEQFQLLIKRRRGKKVLVLPLPDGDMCFPNGAELTVQQAEFMCDYLAAMGASKSTTI